MRGSWVRSLHGHPAAGRRQVGEHAVAGVVGRNPGDAVGHVGDLGRQGPLATVAGQRDRVAVRVEDGPADLGHRVAGGGAQVVVAVLHRAVVQQLLPRGEGQGPGGSLGGLAVEDRVVGGAVAVPRAEVLHLGTHLGDRAEAQRTAELLGDPGEDPRVGERLRVGEDRVEQARPALPGHEHARLVDRRGDREDDVGRARHVGLPQLESDHERRGLERGAESRGVSGVVGVDAADDEATERTGVDRGDDLVGVPAGRLGQGLEAPGRGHVDPGPGVPDWAAAGQQVREAAGLDRAAVTRPSRHPSQPGAGARRQPERRGQRARRRRQPLADHDHRGRVERVVTRHAERVERRGLVAWRCRDERAAHLAEPSRGERRDGDDLGAGAAVGLAQPQEDRSGLVLGLEAGQQHGVGTLEVGVGRGAVARAGEHDVGGEEGRLLGRERPGAEVDVVGAEGCPGELRVGVAVLGGDPAAGQHPHATGRGETARRDGERLGPGGRAQLTVSAVLDPVADLRVAEPVTRRGVVEGEAVLVGDPLLVDLGVVAGEAAHHLAAPVVHADRGTTGVVLGDRRRGDQVEGAGAEAVLGRGQRADRADLDRVAGEVAVVRLLLVDADLLEGAALEQLDERVAGDLGGEAGAARAQHATLPVEQHLGGDVDRLGEGPLEAAGLEEPGLAAAVGHGLVLQRALAALVAHRAVERVVDQQELHDPLLCLVGDLAGDLGVDDHALGDRQGAGRLRLGEPAAVARVGDVDQALSTGTDGRQQGVVAEPRDLDTDLLGGPDHQSVLGDTELDAVDGQRHRLHGVRRRGVGLLGGGRHAGVSSSAKRVDRAGSNGQPPSARCWRYSSRK